MRPRARHERGASAVEYALLLAGVAAVLVVVILVLGGRVGWLLDDACTRVGDEVGTAEC